MLEAIERIRRVIAGVSVEAFENDWERQWLVERGVEIISEASRHLPMDLKNRHTDIPWRKVAGIGNVMRHNYENVAAAVMWKLAREDLDGLEQTCRIELDAIIGKNS